MLTYMGIATSSSSAWIRNFPARNSTIQNLHKSHFDGDHKNKHNRKTHNHSAKAQQHQQTLFNPYHQLTNNHFSQPQANNKSVSLTVNVLVFLILEITNLTVGKEEISPHWKTLSQTSRVSTIRHSMIIIRQTYNH